MVEEYQTRLDIDRLYDLVWDAESNQLKLTQVQDFLALMQKLGFNQDNHVAINFAVITQSNGDIEYWIMDNAYYDYDVNKFIKLDTEKSSQAIQLTNSSVNLWITPSREDVILDYDHYYYDDYLFKNYIGAKSKDDGEWVVFNISSGWTDNGGGGGGSVTPSDDTPSSDSANGSAGTDNKYSRADHSHPLLSSYPPSTHNHDDRYYDKTTSDGRYVKPTGILDLVHPVGSIYISVSSTNPSTLFGGTWERLSDRFLLGAGTTYTGGATGGEATHTLTVDEIPSHRHTVGDDFSSGISGSDDVYTHSASRIKTNKYTSYTGGGQAHNNMPPYLVVYMWKRTA